MKTIYRILPIFLFFAIFSACDLEIKDDFEFKDELAPEITFDDMTAWEWVQTRTSDDLDDLDGEEFDYMIRAIQIAGMVDVYDQTANTDRTYLMLNNNAFTGGGDILQVVTGSAEGDIEDADPERLKNLLQYHVVTSYITQRSLTNFNVDYKFQTLNPGVDGEIYFRRDERLRMSINRSDALPSSASNENVRAHNYVFMNGIGHIIQDYVRNVPF